MFAWTKTTWKMHRNDFFYLFFIRFFGWTKFYEISGGLKFIHSLNQGRNSHRHQCGVSFKPSLIVGSTMFKKGRSQIIHRANSSTEYNTTKPTFRDFRPLSCIGRQFPGALCKAFQATKSHTAVPYPWLNFFAGNNKNKAINKIKMVGKVSRAQGNNIKQSSKFIESVYKEDSG